MSCISYEHPLDSAVAEGTFSVELLDECPALGKWYSDVGHGNSCRSFLVLCSHQRSISPTCSSSCFSLILLEITVYVLSRYLGSGGCGLFKWGLVCISSHAACTLAFQQSIVEETDSAFALDGSLDASFSRVHVASML